MKNHYNNNKKQCKKLKLQGKKKERNKIENVVKLKYSL